MTDDSAVVIRLGNPSPHEPDIEKGVVVGIRHRPDLGEVATTLQVPRADVKPILDNVDQVKAAAGDGASLVTRILTAQALEDWEIALKHITTIVAQHAHAGVTWVASEESKLVEALAAFFDAKEGEPEGFVDRVQKRHAKAAAAAVPQDVQDLAEVEHRRWPEVIDRLARGGDPLALKTKKGVEAVAETAFGTGTKPASFNYFALTENNEAEKDTSTTLTGEYTTASGGLLRKQASFAWTEGSATATLTVTWTANGSDALPFTAKKIGVFNKATSGGTMYAETKITATTWNASGDNATLTYSVPIT